MATIIAEIDLTTLANTLVKNECPDEEIVRAGGLPMYTRWDAHGIIVLHDDDGNVKDAWTTTDMHKSWEDCIDSYTDSYVLL